MRRLLYVVRFRVRERASERGRGERKKGGEIRIVRRSGEEKERKE